MDGAVGVRHGRAASVREGHSIQAKRGENFVSVTGADGREQVLGP